MNIFDELEWRGLVADCTDGPELRRRLETGPIVLYAGFDPTADSLHAGNLVPLLALRRFQLMGHHPIAVAGGATGLVGDPSGRATERQLLTKEALAHNIECVKGQLRRLLDFEAAANPARLLDNAEWTAPVSFLDFLREIGKHFSVNQMMGKESVRARMEEREGGISYTEFSYMLLQAFDFYHLHKEHQCELQIGGSDQWGNITAGMDLTRKKLGARVFGLTLPLILNSDGSKFGKTAAGRGLGGREKNQRLSLLPILDSNGRPRRAALPELFHVSGQRGNRGPGRPTRGASGSPRRAQGAGQGHDGPGAWRKRHGGGGARQRNSFWRRAGGHRRKHLQEIVGEVPTREIGKAKLEGAGTPLVELLAECGLCASKGPGAQGHGRRRRLCQQYPRSRAARRSVTAADLLFGKHLLLRKGKRNYTVLSVK